MTFILVILASKQLGSRNAEEDDDDDQMDNSNAADKENNQDNANDPSNGKKKRKKSRRSAAVITKNPDSLNAKLDTNPFTDPFFAKLNSIVGDINSSNRLMQNMIGTIDGALQLRMDAPFWDPSPKQPIVYDENENYENREILQVDNMDVSDKDVLHQRLHAYQLSDLPAEDDDDEEIPPPASLEHSMNNSGAAVTFDPNAEVEPINDDNDFIMDIGGNENDFEDLEEEDRDAIMRCRGLRRQPVVIEDMRPIDGMSSHLEYSYRPLDMISQFWAGPSHWKFRRTRTTMTKSIGSSAASEDTIGAANQNVRKPRKPRKRKVNEPDGKKGILSLTTEGFIFRDPVKGMKKTMTYSKGHISKKWNAQKLCLPTDRKFDNDMFDKFKFAPQLRPRSHESEIESEVPVSVYNYDNEQDKEYCRQINVSILSTKFY